MHCRSTYPGTCTWIGIKPAFMQSPGPIEASIVAPSNAKDAKNAESIYEDIILCDLRASASFAFNL